MSQSKYATQADYWKAQAVKIVERHRRHVELTAALSEPVRDYALMVCDDILSDLRHVAADLS